MSKATVLVAVYTAAGVKATFLQTQQLNGLSPLLIPLCSVHSNILILLQFISCVAGHTTFMSLQAAGPAETFATQ